MPSHTHTGPSHTHTFSINSGLVGYVNGSSAQRHSFNAGSAYQTISSSNASDIQYVNGNGRTTDAAGTGVTGSAGSGQAFDVRPAYQDIYVWERTA